MTRDNDSGDLWGQGARDRARRESSARRCAHGLQPGYCAIRSCPHWDGVDKVRQLVERGPKRIHSKGDITRKRRRA